MPAERTSRPGPDAAAAPPKRRLSIWRKLLLAVASIAASILLFEVALRALGIQPKTATALTRYFRVHPSYGWEGVPDVECRFATTEFDVFISHDRHGLRRCGLATGIDQDARFDGEVVWYLGDSQTWGWGIDDGETFVDHLNRRGDGRSIHRNLGAAGFGAVQEYLLLREFFARGWRPDRVIVFFTPNDAWDAGTSDGRASRPFLARVGDGFELRNHPVPPWSVYGVQSWLRQHSITYNYIDFLMMSARQERRERERLEQGMAASALPAAADRSASNPPPLTAARQDELLVLREAYALIQAICREREVWLGVVAATAIDAQEVEWTCTAIDVPVLDVRAGLEAYLETREPEPLNFRDAHFTAVGHRLIAAGIDAHLQRVRAEEARAR